MTLHTGALLILTASALTLIMALWAWRLKDNPLASTFGWLMLCCTLYSAGYGLELSSTSLSGMLFWNRIQYLGIPLIGVFFLLLAVSYTGRREVMQGIVKPALFIIPVFTILLRFSNSWHELIYVAPGISRNGPFPLLSFSPGSWYYVFNGYQNLLLGLAGWFYLRFFFKSSAVYRKQTFLMLLGSAIPWLGFMVYITGHSPWNMDLTPMAFTIGAPLWAMALFKYQLFDISPIAREFIFSSMREAVIVTSNLDALVDFNEGARQIFPQLKRSIIGRHAGEVLSVSEKLAKKIKRESRHPRGYRFHIHVNGSLHVFDARASQLQNRRGRNLGWIFVITDVSDQVRMVKKLEKLASRDDLTGVFNRRFLLKKIETEVKRFQRYRRPVALVFFDLDHFKVINDRFGHAAGDRALRHVADVIRSQKRNTDCVGRYGGEEFAVLLPETGLSGGRQVAQRFCDCLNQHRFVYEEKTIPVTASFGVSVLENGDLADLDLLLRKADQALYLAKERGRNRVEVADQ